MTTRERELTQLLQKAQEELEGFNKYVEDLQKTPQQIGTVQKIEGNRLILVMRGIPAEMEVPSTIQVKEGDRVLLHPQTGAISGKSSILPDDGFVTIVQEVLPENRFIILTPGEQKEIVRARKGLTISAGSRVAIVDGMITGVLERTGTSRFRQPIGTQVKWEDVKGQENAVRILQETIEWPRKHKALFTRFNRKPSKGILLWGPPGCGKTLLAKAALNSLAKEAKDPGFFYVKGPEILSAFVSVAEENIREIFSQAREHQRCAKEPALIFIDEADALLRKRGSGISTDIGNTIVPQFLSEMDGLEEDGPLVLLATNEAKSLDSAVVRPGRIDQSVEVKRPGARETFDLFSHYLREIPLEEKDEDYAGYATARIFSRDDLKIGSTPLSSLMSGALVAGVVQESISIAIRRNVTSPSSSDKGLLRADLAEALHITASSRGVLAQ